MSLEERVSPEFLNQIAIRRLIERSRSKKPLDHPIIVAEETYTRVSVRKKLELTSTQLELLINEGLIQPEDPCETLDYRGAPVSNLHFARTSAFLYGAKESKILLPEKYFQSRTFKSRSPEFRVKTLCKAYLGAKWFEIFTSRFNAQTEIPTITKGQMIRISDLPKILKTGEYLPGDSVYNLTRLVDMGFIIPEEGEFKYRSSRNVVNNRALIKLISIISNKKFSEIKREDPSFQDVVMDFMRNKLACFLSDHQIFYDDIILLKQAADLVEIRPADLYRKISSASLAKSEKYLEEKEVSGINLAISMLRPTDYSFTREEVLDIFGTSNINGEYLPNSEKHKTKYDRSVVCPFYDRVAAEAREIVLRNPYLVVEYQARINQTMTFDEIVEMTNEIESALDAKAFRRRPVKL